MAGVTVAVINATTLLRDEQVKAAVSRIWACMQQGCVPDWAADAHLIFVPGGSVLPRCAWALVVMDDVEQATSLVNAESMANALP